MYPLILWRYSAESMVADNSLSNTKCDVFDKCYKMLVDDYRRQGGTLLEDDFNRVVFALRLPTELIVSLKRKLSASEVRITATTLKLNAADKKRPLSFGETSYPDLPLLTHSEEIALARRFLLKSMLDDETSESDLDKQSASNAQAGLVLSNTRLVFDQIAKRWNHCVLPVEDLVQEGMLGLLHASTKYDPERGFRFATYATYWIDQKLQYAVKNKSSTIRLPMHVYEQLSALRKATRELIKRTGREPSSAELGREMGVDTSSVELLKSLRTQATFFSELEFEDSKSTAAQVIFEGDEEQPDRKLEKEELKERIWLALERLDNRARKIVIWRFGLNGRRPKTLEVIGRKLGITRERVRQIEKRSLEKLKKAGVYVGLKDFLEGRARTNGSEVTAGTVDELAQQASFVSGDRGADGVS